MPRKGYVPPEGSKQALIYIPGTLHAAATEAVRRIKRTKAPGYSLQQFILDSMSDRLSKEGSAMSEKQVTFRVDSMVPAGLIQVDGSANPVAAMAILLCLDTRDGSAWITHRNQCENGVPSTVYHGLVLEWSIAVTTDAQRFAADINTGELDALLTRIVVGASTRWNGNNTVGVLSDDARGAGEAVEQWLNDWDGTMPESGGLWEAGDWFQDGVEGFRADMTDEELAALADSLDREALADNVVLADTLQHLRHLRDR